MKAENSTPKPTGLLPRVAGLFGAIFGRGQETPKNALNSPPPGNGKTAKMVVEIANTRVAAIQAEVDLWRLAIARALDPKKPRRDQLMNLYASVLVDNHLSSQIEGRTMRAVKGRFKILNTQNGQEDAAMTALFRTPWFYTFMQEALAVKFHGFSLLEFSISNGLVSNCSLIPRANVIPQLRAVMRDVSKTDELISIDDPNIARFVLLLGDDKDLGLLYKAAPEVIWKKNARGAWSEFAEMFGMPIRVAKHNSNDPAVITALEDAMIRMGAAAYAVIPADASIELRESNRTDASKVYNDLVERCNSEISKLINHATMQSDTGANRAQAEVHERTSEDVTGADRFWLESLINHVLFPFLIGHGYKLTGLTFGWDTTEALSLQQRWAIDQGLLQHFDIDLEHFRATYNVPITGVRRSAGAPTPPAPAPKGRLQPLNLDSLYRGGGHKHGPVAAAPRGFNLLKRIFERISNGAFEQSESPKSDAEYVSEHGNILMEALDEGAGVNHAWDSPDNAQRMALRSNLYTFSGAKSLTALKEMNALLTDENGAIRSFSDFKKDILKLNERYNESWLEAEYNHAVAASRSASQWLELQAGAEDFPNLTYRTVGDDRVRPEHAALDGVTLPLNHPFWTKYFPPNDWGCRCDSEPADGEATLTPASEAEALASRMKVAPMFQNNPAISGFIFDGEHPYFKEAGGELRQLLARDYGLKTVVRIYESSSKLRKQATGTTKEWWEDLRISAPAGEGIHLRDHNDIAAMLSPYMKTRIEGSLGDLSMNIASVLSNPDEVFDNGRGELTYIAYFAEGPITVLVREVDGIVTITGMKQHASDETFEQYREGILIFRK